MTPTVDTSRHFVECCCLHCEANQTGIWATWDVLKRHRTKVVSEAIAREIVALCVARSQGMEQRHAA